ncbi:MEDS domain-containing protein [Geodermatophilus sabuli]|uniref:Anti-anti-sigma regulatory factor (Antagonist of anti-sigma factor) n=1 Tax=Geodermatophilus sabuli TaxID=1564158 RepID=A0A285ECE1_9ACTN|nr:MEDS domain-containing protein [Geodermatophilus sabuli]MBB3084205.1 anti-anti-sigma regulatory factor [Geodermatophilus sabuli]SNX96523.1 Anti-anti-sigma regulatory factor (antagonist of anti-sigma factor) [Geodermatophilus sabuli]
MGSVEEFSGPERGEHVLQLHRTEDERLDGLTAWVSRGLAAGEKVICTELPRLPAGSLVAMLEARGVDGAAAVRDRRLAVLPAEDFYAAEGHTAVAERALAEGFPGVRVSAEERAWLTVLSPAAHQVVERQMDELVCTRPVRTLCQYPQASTTGAELQDVVAVHRSGVRETVFATTRDLDGLALHGEIDGSNTDVFRAVLAVASRRASRVLWLDLADAAHLDAGGCWRLDDATRAFRAAGGYVLLIAPQPPVELILQLMEVDELPGMHLMAGRP